MDNKKLKVYLDNCCYNRPNAEKYEKLGIKQYDALHIACAVEAKCDYFLTTDKGILKKNITDIKTINPIDFMREVYNHD